MGHANELVDLSRRRERDQQRKYRAWKDVGVVDVDVDVVVVAVAAAVAVVVTVDVAAVVDFSSFVVVEPSFHQRLER